MRRWGRSTRSSTAFRRPAWRPPMPGEGGGFGLGTVIGGYYCGKVGRLLTIRLARRNGGISEPEHTLYLFLLSAFLVPFGLILYGLGITYHIHWIGLIVSQTIMAVNSSLCIATGLGYTIAP